MSWRARRRIYVLPNGKQKIVWVARFQDSRGNVRIAKPAWNNGKGTFELRRLAQRAIDEALAAGPGPDRASTLGAYFPRWLETRPRSERTNQTNKTRISAVLDVELESVPLEDWDMRDLKRRHRDLLVTVLLVGQGRSPGGARNILRALSAMFEDAITDELADINPWTHAKIREDDQRARKHARPVRTWDFEQMHRLARACGKYEAMVRMFSDCGLRLGEVFALERACVHGDTLEVRRTAYEGRILQGTKTDHGKQNAGREVPVPPGLQALINQIPVRIDTPLLFPTPTGKMWRSSNFYRKILFPAQEITNVYARPHEMRHSWVSWLRAGGVDPADLAAVSGHSVETATALYTHALHRSDGRIRELVG